jgi:cation diffusion facilitator family transporter
MLIANARNMQNDVLISFSVLFGLIFTFILRLPILDSIVALAVSLWIIKVGIQIFIQTDRDLMDGVSDPELYKKVFCAIDRVPEAYHPHRLRIRKIGNYYMIALDIEVDGSLTTVHAHQIVCRIEQSIRQDIPNIFDTIIHVEPVGTKEKEENYGISKEDLVCD